MKNSNQKIFTIECKVDGCPFRISCNKRQDEKVFISRLTLQHTCALLNNQTKVTAAFVADSVLETVTDNPEITIGHIRNNVKRENNLPIGFMKAYRAKNMAHEVAFGNMQDSFKKIPSFLETVCQAGGNAFMESEDSRFKRCFICLYQYFLWMPVISKMSIMVLYWLHVPLMVMVKLFLLHMALQT